MAGDPQASIKAAAGPAGDFLYRFGDPARYAQGDPPRVLENWDAATAGDKQIGGCHDVHWIRPGLPGAGHILIFNNGQYLCERTAQSSIVEINPFLDAQGRNTGRYVNPPDAGYEQVRFPRDTHKLSKRVSKQIVWSFQSRPTRHSSAISVRLATIPNGNTLICSGTSGHLFEVTAQGELVWEYINPVSRELGTVKILPDCLPMTKFLFRSLVTGPTIRRLRGKDLTPKGTITDAFPRKPDPRGRPAAGTRPRRPPRPRRQRPRRGGRRGDGGDDDGRRGGGGRGSPDAATGRVATIPIETADEHVGWHAQCERQAWRGG